MENNIEIFSRYKWLEHGKFSIYDYVKGQCGRIYQIAELQWTIIMDILFGKLQGRCNALFNYGIFAISCCEIKQWKIYCVHRIGI